MAFNSLTGIPSIPRDRNLIRHHPLDMWLIQRKQLIFHLLGTPIIHHRMVARHHTQQRYPPPRHRSFESFVDQRDVVAASAPPGDASVLKKMKEFAACFSCFVVYNAKACDKRGFL